MVAVTEAAGPAHKESKAQKKRAPALSPATIVPQVLNECQKSFTPHKRSAQVLAEALASNPVAFRDVFVQHLNRLLPIFKRELPVERVVRFVGHFVSTLSCEDELPLFLLSHLLSLHNAKEKAVRFRVCQLIAVVMDHLPEDYEVVDELYEAVLEAMTTRMSDKVPVVRAEAACALARLQAPTDPEDPVLVLYTNAIHNDGSREVRKAVMNSLGISGLTLPLLIGRTRDVKDDVRKAAFHVITEKVEMKWMTIAQRITILRQGLADRAPSVRKAVADMLARKWLKSAGGDVVSLLGFLDVETYEDTCCRVVHAVLGAQSRPRPVTVNTDSLTPESALFWRAQAEFFFAKKDDDNLEALLVEVPRFCLIVAAHYTAEFVMKQLLITGRFLETSDEGGRQRLSKLLHKLLIGRALHDGLIPATMATLRVCTSTETEHVAHTLALAQEIMDDANDDVSGELQAVEEEMDELEAAMEAVRADMENISDDGEDSALATAATERLERLEAKFARLDAKKTKLSGEDEWRWSRVLAIVAELFEHTEAGMSCPEDVAMMKEQYVYGAVKHHNPLVRSNGLRALGLSCLMDSKEALRQLFLFIQVMRNDQPELQLVAVKAVFDIVLKYDVEHHNSEVDPEDEDSPPLYRLDEIVTELRRYLTSDDEELLAAAVEGFAKLIMMRRCSSTEILSNLIILLFSPTTEDNARVRQCLSVFFPAFALAGSTAEANSENQKLFEAAFMDTIRVCMQAPKKSPLSDINLARLAEFLLYLTALPAPEEQAEETSKETPIVTDTTIHERLALAIAGEIVACCRFGFDAKPLCKIISLPYVRPQAQFTVKSLKQVVYNLRKDKNIGDVTDKASQKLLDKYYQTLGDMEVTKDTELAPEKIVELEETIAACVAEREKALKAAVDDGQEIFGLTAKGRRRLKDAQAPAKTESSRPRRNASRKQTFVEESDEEPSMASDDEVDEDEVAAAPVRATRSTRASTRKAPAKKSSTTAVMNEISELLDSDDSD